MWERRLQLEAQQVQLAVLGPQEVLREVRAAQAAPAVRVGGAVAEEVALQQEESQETL